ncbi:MAG: DtxR family transcriptional regulator, Mn-dependent transcriptional regulator [Acidimicrobiaceae bacterium]|jgi:DtxR family Mn-dependent transcriptional regulator|nr:DtxR family transcriptional regulator, Mn-dependent transcriptional regulator [Acidimicrobiaceae bacterium]
MSQGVHPPLEEYLEAIHELQEEGSQVIQARLVERLGHSAPTVSEMVRRLRDEGYLEVDRRIIALTAQGQRRAESVVRKHRLAERLLTDIIGLEWHKAHAEAGRWEHVISDEVEVLLVKLLDNPTTCPHGNPIPGTSRSAEALVALDTSEPGAHIRLARVTEQVELDLDSLTYLSSHGFLPGVRATVRSKAPDGTLVLDLDDTEDTIALGPSLAHHLYVGAA